MWERPRSTRILECGAGEGRAASAGQKKTRSASGSRLLARRLLSGEPWTPGLRLPLPTRSPFLPSDFAAAARAREARAGKGREREGGEE